MFWVCINGECATQPRDAEAGGLRHAVIKTPRWANLCLPACNWKWVALCQPCIYSDCLSLTAPKTWSGNKKIHKTYILTQWENEQKGRALWCRWSLIKFFEEERLSVWLTEECAHGVCIVSATGHCTTGGSVYLPDSSPCHIMVMKLSAACSHLWPMH